MLIAKQNKRKYCDIWQIVAIDLLRLATCTLQLPRPPLRSRCLTPPHVAGEDVAVRAAGKWTGDRGITLPLLPQTINPKWSPLLRATPTSYQKGLFGDRLPVSVLRSERHRITSDSCPVVLECFQRCLH